MDINPAILQQQAAQAAQQAAPPPKGKKGKKGKKMPAPSPAAVVYPNLPPQGA